MTRAPAHGDQQGGDAAAAGWFAGILTLALGGAGLIIAALAVGAERAWTGGRTEGSRQRERGRGWLDTQRAWLEQDHQNRAGRAAAYRDWLSSGANPAAAPARPSWWRRLREGTRRLTAHVAVGGQDFAAGARDGWRAADNTRRGGGTFRQVATSRPQPARDTVPEQPATAKQQCRNCRRPHPLDYSGVCADCRRPTPPPDERAIHAPDPLATEVPPTNGRPLPPGSNASFQPTERDLTMTQPAQQPAASAAESNATVLRAKLRNTETTLKEIADLTDQLAKARTTLDTQVRDADEFATATGQSAQARTALDESRALAEAMGARLGEFSQGAVCAEDTMHQASDGLKVAENAEDELRAAGADGRAIAPAGANA